MRGPSFAGVRLSLQNATGGLTPNPFSALYSASDYSSLASFHSPRDKAALQSGVDNRPEKGGHSAAWEQPQLFAEEVRAGLRPLRK